MDTSTPTAEELEAMFNATSPTSTAVGIVSFQVYGPGRTAPDQDGALPIGRVDGEESDYSGDVLVNGSQLQFRATAGGKAVTLEVRLLPLIRAMSDLAQHELGVCGHHPAAGETTPESDPEA